MLNLKRIILVVCIITLISAAAFTTHYVINQSSNSDCKPVKATFDHSGSRPSMESWQVKQFLSKTLRDTDFYQPTCLPEFLIKINDSPDINDFGMIITGYKSSNQLIFFTMLQINEKSDAFGYGYLVGVTIPNQKVLLQGIANAHYAEGKYTPLDPGSCMNCDFPETTYALMFNKGKTKIMMYFLVDSKYPNKADLKQLLISMARSVAKVNIPQLVLNDQELKEKKSSDLSFTSSTIINAINLYKQTNNLYPWESDQKCNGGLAFNQTQVSSPAFSKCLDLIQPNISKNEKYYNPTVLNEIFLSMDGDIFWQQNYNDPNSISVINSSGPRACYHPPSVDNNGDNIIPLSYFDTGYPLYSRSGKVSFQCKNNHLDENCFSCYPNLPPFQ